MKGNDTSKTKTNFDVFLWKISFHLSDLLDVSDDEVICLEHKKTQDKRPVDAPRKYHELENYKLDINELHNFNEILQVDQWYSEHYI